MSLKLVADFEINKQYLQLLTRPHGLPKYAGILVKRANHGWGITVKDIGPRSSVRIFHRSPR